MIAVSLPAPSQLATRDQGLRRCYEFPIDYYETPNRPSDLLSADFDGDGFPDLVTGSSDPDGQPILFHNRGDGSYERGGEFPLPDLNGWAIGTTGDFDADGDVDLTLHNRTIGFVLLLNRGDATFSTQATGRVPFWATTTADMDRDGDLDLIGSTAGIRFNLGDGVFGPTESFPTNGWIPVAADVNGDGLPDLAVWHPWYFEILLNLGGGKLGPPKHFDGWDLIRELEAADIDGDGDSDLVTADYNTGGDGPLHPYPSELSVYRSLGDGSLAPREHYQIGPGAQSLTQGDFDLDGDVDFAVLVRLSCMVTVFHNDGSGRFEEQHHYMSHQTHDYWNSETTLHRVQAVDTDSDGWLDLVLTYENEQQIGVLHNLGNGRFDGHSRYYTRVGAGRTLFSDLDADGDLDMVACKVDTLFRPGCETFVFPNSGEGSFGTPEVIGLQCPLASADFDGNGFNDLIAFGCNGGKYLILNEGHGGFQEPVFLPSHAQGVWTVGDLDGDGDVDLAGSAGTLVNIAYNDGQADFSSFLQFDRGVDRGKVYSADVDGDGDIDLLAIDESTGMAALLVNRGNGLFRAPRPFTVGGPCRSVNVADLDSDGSPDLALLKDQEHRVAILLNRGDGSFSEPALFLAGMWPSSLGSGDLDGDGHVDLVIGRGREDGEYRALTLFNRGDATFELPEEYRTGRNIGSVTAIDLNGDGQAELVYSGLDTVTVARSSCR